jgi:hypothetical protein
MPFLGAAGIGGLIAFLKVGALPSAITGGILSEDSTYFYRTFLGSSTLTVTGGVLNADVLVVGGGGGGDQGGGGAGGYIAATTVLTPTAYTVTIGSGGAGGNLSNNTATNGANSSLGALYTAIGGGAGRYQNFAGLAGGSGGGGGANGSYAGGAATSGQGNIGGYGFTTTSGGGGGGGAGAAGQNAPSGTQGGAGGAGIQWLNGSYYAGGGGGGASSTGGAGGIGGGGAGNTGVTGGRPGSAPIFGTTNTGGGGGGIYNNYPAADGGSGIVIVRYKKTAIQTQTSAYELIGTVSLSATQSSITFAGIPSSQYKHLQLRITTRNTSNVGGDDTLLQINGDATYTNYRSHYLYASGSTFNAANMQSTSFPGANLSINVSDSGSTAGAFGVIIVDILDAFSTTKLKTIKSFSGAQSNAGNQGVTLASAIWTSTAAVTSLTVLPYAGVAGSFATGSRVSLYGLRG